MPSVTCIFAVILESNKTSSLNTVGGVCGLSVVRTDVEYEIAFGETTVENMAKFSLPDDLQDMVTLANGSYGYMGAVDVEFQIAVAAQVISEKPCSEQVGRQWY